MKIISIFNDSGRSLQEIMEQFLIIYFYDNITKNKYEKNNKEE